MGMTPADVEQKTFSTVLRGYDLDEVDDFLDDVIATIRDLQDQIVETKASNPVADSTPVESESVIGRVLMTAQVTADTMIADAREEANQILADVLSEADSWATERDAKKKAAEEEMTELTHHVAGVRTQLAVLATEVADRLDEMDDSIGGHHQTDQDLDISPDDGEDPSDVANSHVGDDDSGDDDSGDDDSGDDDSGDDDSGDDDSGDDDTNHGSDAGMVGDEEDDELGNDSTGELSSMEHDDRGE
ncbi:MAG: DivIVA domain-containing protein [Acidobacteria bacterium]|nr:DivIVA domain-containing protein [Acidobacteriota bacterium]